MSARPATEERRAAAAVGEALLDVRDLSVSFGGRSLAEAVRDVSLTIGRGEACGLVGESGSGKSSLASALLNVLPVGGRVTSGSIVFDGQELTGLDERGWRRIRGRRIAMVFQEASMALDPLMTVGGHLKEALLLSASLRRGAAERRALELVQEVGISDPERRLRQYPHELSGGMRQRILIALALAGDPDLLVADEPTTALDVTVQAQVLELLRTRQLERGMAMLLISHSLPIISSVVDRVLVMYGGRIMESGRVQELSGRRAIPTRRPCSSRTPTSTATWSSAPSRAARRAPAGCPPGARSPRAARTGRTSVTRVLRRSSRSLRSTTWPASSTRSAAHERATPPGRAARRRVQDARRPPARRRRRRPRARPWRDARARRRERLREDDARPGDHAARAGQVRPRLARRRRPARAERQGPARRPAARPDRIPGPGIGAERAHDRRRPRRGAARRPLDRTARRAAGPGCRRCSSWSVSIRR